MFSVTLTMALTITTAVTLETVHHHGVMSTVTTVAEITVTPADLVCTLYIHNVYPVSCLTVSCANYAQFLVSFTGHCFDKYFDCKELLINGTAVCEHDIDIKYGCRKSCGFCDGKPDIPGETQKDCLFFVYNHYLFIY